MTTHREHDSEKPDGHGEAETDRLGGTPVSKQTVVQATEADAANGYRLFLLREPENETRTAEKVGLLARDLAAEFLSSGEFLSITERVSTDGLGAIQGALKPLPRDVVNWAASFFNLSDRARNSARSCRDWCGLLLILLYDNAFYESLTEAAQLGVSSIIRDLELSQFAPKLTPSFPHPDDQEEADGMRKLEEAFDPQFYREQYPGITASKSEQLRHYLDVGWREGADPARWFSTRYYLENNSDIAGSGINPFLHYVRWGQHEPNRQPQRGYRGLDCACNPWERQPVLHLPARSGRADPAAPGLAQPRRLGVHLHVFYEELAEPLMVRLKAIPGPFTLVITAHTEQLLKSASEAAERVLPDVAVIALKCQNRGRDIAPFIIEFGKRAGDFDFVLHVHTKKSKEKEEVGRQWSQGLLDGLVRDRCYAEAIFALFESDPACGIIMPEPPTVVRPFINWGANQHLAHLILERFGIEELDPQAPLGAFPAGFMFWARSDALKPLFEGGLTYGDFPEEPIEADGTIAHALERCLPQIAARGGYEHAWQVAPIDPALTTKPPAYQISVVVPIFNAGEVLHATIQSILRRATPGPNVELILVDNASTDRSAEIAKFYASNFANVRYLMEPSRGAGAARNAGLDAATGEYITFVDADDLISTTALADLLEVAKSTRADLVTSPLRVMTLSTAGPSIPPAHASFRGVVPMAKYVERWTDYPVPHDEAAFMAAMFSDFGPCAKLYSRAFLEQSGLRFPTNGNFEDNRFIYAAYLNASIIANCPKPTYFYRRFESDAAASQSRSVSVGSVSDFVGATLHILSMSMSLTNRVVRAAIGVALSVRLAEHWTLFAPVLDKHGELRVQYLELARRARELEA